MSGVPLGRAGAGPGSRGGGDGGGVGVVVGLCRRGRRRTALILPPVNSTVAAHRHEVGVTVPWRRRPRGRRRIGRRLRRRSLVSPPHRAHPRRRVPRQEGHGDRSIPMPEQGRHLVPPWEGVAREDARPKVLASGGDPPSARRPGETRDVRSTVPVGANEVHGLSLPNRSRGPIDEDKAANGNGKAGAAWRPGSAAAGAGQGKAVKLGAAGEMEDEGATGGVDGEGEATVGARGDDGDCERGEAGGAGSGGGWRGRHTIRWLRGGS